MKKLSDELECLSAFAVEFRCSGEEAVFSPQRARRTRR